MSSLVVPGAVLTAVLVGAGVAGWQVFVERDAGDPFAYERCVATAARRLDSLERLADERFRALPHTTSRYDGCDDTGRPSASLSVWVEGWMRRREGVTWLQAAGDHWNQRDQLATFDGPGVTAWAVRSDDEKGTHVGIVLWLP